jgi:hypothetical protein
MFDCGEIISYAVVMRRELVKAMGEDVNNLADSVCEIMDDYLPAIMSNAMKINAENQDNLREYLDHQCEGNQ